MRFMIIRKADANTEASAQPSAELVADMMKYNHAMIDAGVMVDGQGLHASAKGARLSFSQGKPTVIDGPFSETKELIAGITIIEVASLAEALAWAARWPASDGDGSVQLEVRQVVAPEDFGPEFADQLRAHDARLRHGGSAT